MRILRCLTLWLALCASASAAIPAKPDKYFNDYAGLVSAETAARLEQELENFERQTSSQILVVIYPKLPENDALEDFAVRTFQAWKVGVAGKDNGAVLFIFRDDRKLRIEVGYGLEGAIPDSIAKRIIDEQISPRFRRGDFEGGVSAGVTSLMQAARGEYRGTGRTVAERGRRAPAIPLFAILLIFIMIVAFGVRNRGTVYHRRRRNYWGGGWPSSGGGGWSRGGGGGSWSGGGGFMGGGGRSGGGGASGGW